MNRHELVETHLKRIVDHFQKASSIKSDASAVDLTASRQTLNSYSTELLVDLLGTEDDDYTRTGNTLHVYRGRPERWVRIYMALSDAWSRFDGGAGYETLTIHEAVDSLPLYPELGDEDAPDYVQKVIAITGVTIDIQYQLPSSESRTAQVKSRLLTYDPKNEANTFGRTVRFTNPALVELVLRRHEQWKTIARIVTERKTDDTEMIESILDGDIFEIANGTL